MNFKGQGHSPLKAIGQTPTLLFESKNNVSINSYSITYAVKTKSGMNFKGQGHSPLKAIGILTMVFYTYGPNLVILASTSDESSHGQIWWWTDGLRKGRTDGQMDEGNDNTRRPKLASGKICVKITIFLFQCAPDFIFNFHYGLLLNCTYPQPEQNY